MSIIMGIAGSVLGGLSKMSSASAQAEAAAAKMADAAYNNTYQNMTSRYNGIEAMAASQRTIANIQQSEINQKLNLDLQSDAAEAAATVQAAAMGAEGGSVDARVDQMEVEKVMKSKMISDQAANAIEMEAAKVGSAVSMTQRSNTTQVTNASGLGGSSLAGLGSFVGAGADLLNSWETGALQGEVSGLMESFGSLWGSGK